MEQTKAGDVDMAVRVTVILSRRMSSVVRRALRTRSFDAAVFLQ
jgi:hypothetical protein